MQSLILILTLIFCVRSDWPLSNNSDFHIIGLFSDAENVTQRTLFSIHSRAMFQAAMILAQRHNYTIAGRPIGWRSFQTGACLMTALSYCCSSIATKNVIGIVGPAYSREAHIMAPFGFRVGIPVISYSATAPDLQDISVYPSFYRTVPSDAAAAVALLQFFKKYNWTSCTIIHENDAFGIGGASVITRVFMGAGVSVEKTIEYDMIRESFRGNLKELLVSAPTRIVILWASLTSSLMILKRAIEFDVMAPQFTWILSSSIAPDSFNSTFSDSLVGMLAIEPVVASVAGSPYDSSLLSSALQIWKEFEPDTLPTAEKLDSYALFAFDAALSLVKALVQICRNTDNAIDGCVQLKGPPYCFNRTLQNTALLHETLRKNTLLGVSGYLTFSNDTTNRVDGIYYEAKNYQKISGRLRLVRVMTYSSSSGWIDSEDQHGIMWPDGSSKPSRARPKLRGVKLLIGAPSSPPFVFLTNTTNASGHTVMKAIGYMIDVVEALQAKLGFEATIVVEPNGKSYTQLVQELPTSKYDMLIGDITVNAIRRDLVEFSNSIFENSLRIMTRKSNDPEIDLFSYLKPFSRSLWLLVSATALFAAILICLIERNEIEAEHGQSLRNTFGLSLWYSIGVLLGYGVDFHARTPAGRLLTVGLYFLSLVFVATYTANLASDLTVSKTKQIISGIEDLKSGKVPFNRIGVRVGTAIEDFYLREISGGSRNFFPLTTEFEQYELLLNETVDIMFADASVAEHVVNNIYCNLTLVGADFDKSSFGMVFRKGWIHAEEIDIMVLSLRESGGLDAFRKKWLQSKTCPDDQVTGKEIGIESLSGLFLTFAMISCISLIIFIAGKCSALRNWLSWSKFQAIMSKFYQRFSSR